MITTEKAKARIDSDLRKLDEPYQSQLRSFIGKSLMQRALEEEMAHGRARTTRHRS